MADEPISDKLASYLLAGIDGLRFERLIQDLLHLLDVDRFVALGGMRDGGADGFYRSLAEAAAQPGHYIQISKQESIVPKIKATIASLRKAGRQIQTLTYWTSTKESTLDLLEDRLTRELGVTVRVRDLNACLNLFNRSRETCAHVSSTFRAEIFELTAQSHSGVIPLSVYAADPSVYVFLQFEVATRAGRQDLAIPVIDALLFWALRGTDPETKKFLSRNEIKDSIRQLLPGAAATLLPHVDNRLQILSTKAGSAESRIRAYRATDSFCLPFSMRVELAEAGATEIALLQDLETSLRRRALELEATNPDAIATVCIRAIAKHFQEQGLILAAFLEKRLDDITISDQVVELELQAVTTSGLSVDARSYAICLAVLRAVFYTPTVAEHTYLQRLSRTSLLFFSLRHHPKLIEFFNSMTGKFRLLVGSDILIKAISESFLPSEHKHVTNLLRVARKVGAKLILTDPVADEIFTHLHAAHLEFRNFYAPRESYITPSIASQCNRILIRTYFYARLLVKKVASWQAFINRFVDPEELSAKSRKGRSQLAAWLCKTYELTPMAREDIAAGVDSVKLNSLAADLLTRNVVKHEMLARNDALIVLAVYAQRRMNNEVEAYDGFGLKTWWLTKETRVLSFTANAVAENGGIPYIMRPEFLLNFLSLSPRAADATADMADLIPSHVGLQIGQHLSSDHMHRILEEIDNWKGLPAERVEVKMSDAVDRLKFDRLKRYESNLDLQGGTEADEVINSLRGA